MAEIINVGGFAPLSVESLSTPEGMAQLNNMLVALYKSMPGDGVNVGQYYGYGTPEASIAASVGSTYLRLDGSTNTTFYRKETGSGNTGWIAVTNLTTPITVANGGTGADFSAAAQGSIFYFSAAGVLSALSPGTSGYFLKSQGAAANPVWDLAKFASYVNGSIVESTAATERTTANSSLTKVKELTDLNRAGSVTISWEHKATGGATNANSKLYINGVAVGSLKSTSLTTYAEVSESNVTVAIGDNIQVYAQTDGSASVEVKNLKIKCANPTVPSEEASL